MIFFVPKNKNKNVHIINNLCQIYFEYKIFFKRKKGCEKLNLQWSSPKRKKIWVEKPLWLNLHIQRIVKKKHWTPPPKPEIPKRTFKCKTISQLDNHIIQYLKNKLVIVVSMSPNFIKHPLHS